MESCSFCNLDAMGVESLKEDGSEPFHIQIDGLERRADDPLDYGCKFFLMRHSICQNAHQDNRSIPPARVNPSVATLGGTVLDPTPDPIQLLIIHLLFIDI